MNLLFSTCSIDMARLADEALDARAFRRTRTDHDRDDAQLCRPLGHGRGAAGAGTGARHWTRAHGPDLLRVLLDVRARSNPGRARARPPGLALDLRPLARFLVTRHAGSWAHVERRRLVLGAPRPRTCRSSLFSRE